jgi:hypothetical protein
MPRSAKTVPPISPTCPTCGKEMTLTGVAPTCDGTIYDYQCSNDWDRLSWRPLSFQAKGAMPLIGASEPRSGTIAVRILPS